MGSPGSTSDGTRRDILGVFAEHSEARTPLSTVEVAEYLECSERTAEEKLEALADRGELRTRDVDGERRIWWRPDGRAESTEELELEEYATFVNAVQDYAIFTLDPDGAVVSWNEGAARIKGYSAEEIVGEHFSAFYTDEDVAAGLPAENLDTAREEGRTEDEGWRVREDGTEFWADVVITAIRDDDGTLRGFTKVTRDMTEQQEYEQRLRQERNLVEQILGTVPVSIAVIDSESKFVRANQQALDRLAVEQPSLAEHGPDSWVVYDADDEPIPVEERPWTRALETGEPVYDYQCQVDLPEMGRRWITVNVAPIDSPDHDEQVVLAVDDITELKERERQLQRRKAELETELSEVLGRISDAFYALDDEWRFTHLNERAAEIMDRSREDLLGREVWETLPDGTENVVREEFRTAMDSQEPVSFEVHAEDVGAWLEFAAYPSESGLSVYFRDVTERKERERKLEESNERLEQFAYAASHDLQEPLRMVSSYLQLIERRYADELDADGREFLEFAVDGADRMRGMIDALLQYSRVETRGDPFEPVDLDDVLSEALENLQVKIDESDAEVTVDPLPRVEGDEEQLRQLFQNLLDNAMEYSGDDPPEIHVGAERVHDRWEVSVRDEGIGIDPDDQERVFEVFQSLHTSDEHAGMGIGLALCERIAERHGGDVRVDSAPGEGSTFTIALPAEADGDE